MPVLNATAANSLVIVGKAANSKLVVATLSVAGDWRLFDGLESVTFRTQGSKTVVDGKVIEGGQASTVVPHALRRELSRKVIDASGGRYRAGDVIFEIPAEEYSATPRPGDKIVVADGSTWNVLSADYSTLTSRWRVISRNG